jgi:hypothetical protein
MNTSSHGGGKGWIAARGTMRVSTAHHRDLPGPVVVGGVTYNGTGGTRTWTFNDKYANNYGSTYIKTLLRERVSWRLSILIGASPNWGPP